MRIPAALLCLALSAPSLADEGAVAKLVDGMGAHHRDVGTSARPQALVGPDEVRAWTNRQGSLAPQAAGVIHSDFERGFIRAEVMKYHDLIKLGSEQKVREVGRYMQKGRDYVVEDGEILSISCLMSEKN